MAINERKCVESFGRPMAHASSKHWGTMLPRFSLRALKWFLPRASNFMSVTGCPFSLKTSTCVTCSARWSGENKPPCLACKSWALLSSTSGFPCPPLRSGFLGRITWNKRLPRFHLKNVVAPVPTPHSCASIRFFRARNSSA